MDSSIKFVQKVQWEFPSKVYDELVKKFVTTFEDEMRDIQCEMHNEIHEAIDYVGVWSTLQTDDDKAFDIAFELACDITHKVIVDGMSQMGYEPKRR